MPRLGGDPSSQRTRETMNIADVAYLPEQPAHEPEIEQINAEAFGPGRFARAAYKIREGGPHERALSFVAICDGAVIASVRMTRVAAGEGRALLLGPLAVRGGTRYARNLWHAATGVGFNFFSRVGIDVAAFQTTANIEEDRRMALAVSLRIDHKKR